MNKNKKKILFVTGTRADYGKLKPLIECIEVSDDFEAYIFVTGMHMLSRYGATVNEVKKGGFKNIYTFINHDGITNAGMDLTLAHTIQGLGHYIREFPPDLIVVHGDRVETIAGAIVGALNNILVAHIEGGELSGTIDELIRHSVTKLSHIHFVSNSDAAKRLRQLGEVAESIFEIGSPDIDVMFSGRLPSLMESRIRYDISFDEYGIFMYHPVTTEVKKLQKNITAVIDALNLSAQNYLCIYPNNDHGSEIIISALYSLQENSRFRVIPSVRFEHFLTLLKNALVIVGNSSAGIREAPVYGIPTVNIGTRQKNRFQHSTIVNVTENAENILAALQNLPPRAEPSMHFGKGNSAELFMEVLNNPNLWNLSLQKQFCDL